MRAEVIYESMYGNTHRIAEAIGAGLQAFFEVTVVPVAQAGPALLADVGLVVVGGPTHAHGMSRAATREAALEAAEKPDSDVTLEIAALGPGLVSGLARLASIRSERPRLTPGSTGPLSLPAEAP